MNELLFAAVNLLSVALLVFALAFFVARGKARISAEKERLAIELADHYQSVNKKLSETAIRERNRADTQFKAICDATNETRATWSLYRKQAIEAGNAQAWLFRVLSEVIQMYNNQAKKHGFEPYELDPRLKNVVDTYREQHVSEDAARANQKKLLESS